MPKHNLDTSLDYKQNPKNFVDGDCSNSVCVRSGIPQGTALGPLMFILYINDIAENTTSTIMLFADDCLLYCSITDQQDAAVLQHDLDTLCNKT